MSKQNSFDTAADRLSRRNRIHSVGLPSQTTLLPDPSLALNKNAPAVPRRHSAAPMVSAPPIPLRPPAIPKRNKNERPIPIVNPSRFEAKNQAAIQNPAQKPLADNSTYDGWDRLESSKPNPSCDPDYARRCFNNYALHFDRSSIDPNLQVPSRTLHFNQRLQEYDSNIYDIDELKNVNSATQSGSEKRKQNEENGSTNSNGSKLEKTFLMKYENSSASDKNYDSKVENFFADKPSKFEEWQKKSQELENRLECGGDDKVQKLRQEIIGEKLKRIPKATQTNIPPPLNAICQNSTAKPTNIRQDSNISSDSYSQTSSPSYTNKTMEAPLLPQKYGHGKIYDCITGRESKNPPTSPIIKSVSTPASLQTIVKFHNGSNMSLHNRIIKDIRRPSSHYVTKARFRFRFAQVLINAIALIIITGCFTAYIKTYPHQTAKMKNKTVYNEIINTLQSISSEPIIAEPKNPSPGVCLPVIVSFCQYHKIPYNFTVFPNYMGNFGQREAQNELHLYDSVVDVKCYELAALFLCSIFVPKCGSNGHVVPPCRSLCIQTMRRCGFFLEVFGLPLPDYLKCELFSENSNPDICVGQREVIEAAERASKPVCTNGFQCDDTRCIPLDWNCDGHIDCEDKTDETNCSECENDVHLMTLDRNKSRNETSISKLQLHCGDMKCLSPYIICDGVMDCPWGQDERYCLKLSDSNGDIASGRLEVYHAEKNTFIPACITRWDESTTAQNICSYLGYATVISSNFSMKNNNTSLVRAKPQSTLQSSRFSQKNIRGLLKSFQSCADQKNHRTLDLACSNYVCGRRRYSFRNAKVRTRIVGGVEVSPGDWPFLAALLGGPEEVFYCAGVLISDQWVLTASHCVGNYSNVSGWTIQLGITRRNSHTYLGEKLKVKRVVPHPNYDLEIVHDNDVALFQLANKVKFHEHLRPVCLPKANEEIEPQTVCTVIGWGKKNDTEFSEYEFAINEVEVPVLPRDVCNSWLEHKDLNVTDGMICAGYASGEKDACQGDSGGPLLCRDKHDREKWFVGGIVSWGIKCAYPKLPGVYAYVPKYIPWIQKEIAKYTEQS